MVETTESPTVAPQGLGFILSHQQLELEVDFKMKSLNGKTTITIIPTHKELKSIRLNCRQCILKSVTLNGLVPLFSYQEPYSERFRIHDQASVHQHHQLRERMAGQLKYPPEEELEIDLPMIVIEELTSASPEPQVNIKKEPEEAAIVPAKPRAKSTDEQGLKYKPITIEIEYTIETFRDGLRFVGWELGGERYPHVYTINSPLPGSACCLFPCVDDAISRCTWDISIKCARTLGDALRFIHDPSSATRQIKTPVNVSYPYPRNPCFGLTRAFVERTTRPNGRRASKQIMREVIDAMHPEWRRLLQAYGDDTVPKTHEITVLEDRDPIMLSDEDAARDMTVVCSGELVDENVDPVDPSKKVVSFVCSTAIAACHIGFSIGPYEYMDLADLRESDEDEKLGQSAVQLHGYCLPGRAEELRNTCFPTAKAVDYFTLTYGSYPFNSYAVCFVDELASDIAHAASLSICSERLLFPEDVIEPLERVTRQLVHALAYQWIGIYIIPKETSDTWITVGIAHFITDMFMKKLCGNNDYRFRQKKNAERICEMDIGRPSLSVLGSVLSLDPSELEFMALKSAMVLFILDRRLTKASGSTGLTRIISRVFLNAKTGELANGCITNAQFHRTCEKLGHTKLDIFFQQWIHGGGCPRFMVTQRFNKKKLVVEMLIRQVQNEQTVTRALEPENFVRDLKENLYEVKPAPVQPVFTGPMTIRIHEADGTPYEHTVEIREGSSKFEIPYNTKYKRLKRSRRQKEKAAAGAAVDINADGQDEVVLYSLGDVLQSEEDIRSWRLADWTKEDEDKMNQESYEWIRMDADFEWICKMSMAMPGYMYLSQLQQDRDVVAQYESIQYIAAQNETPLVSTILLRTLMDRRYFYGIRVSAAHALAKCGKEELDWIGLFHLEKAFQKFFCRGRSDTTPINDFSDRSAYYIQCAIPQAIAKVRDHEGNSPLRAKRFLYGLLRLNDNSKNKYRDWHYVSTLMNALCDTLIRGSPGGSLYSDDDDEFEENELLKNGFKEIDRYRLREEFEPTWNSICSITALNCKIRLAKANLAYTKITDFLQYTSPDNDDLMRVAAFGHLISFAGLRRDRIVSYVLATLSKDPSPYVRENVRRLFFKGLGAIAVGEDESENIADKDELTVEDESSTADRQKRLARKQSMAGALDALKSEMGYNDDFKKALWKAIASKMLSLAEMRDLLDLCRVLFEQRNSLVVKLRYPRYYRCEYLGKGIMKFVKTNKFRTQRSQGSLLVTGVAPTVQRSAPRPAPRPAPQPAPGSESDSDSPLIKREEAARTNMPPPGLPKLKINTNTKKRANSEMSSATAEPAPKKQRKSSTAKSTPATVEAPTPAASAQPGPKSKKRSNAEMSTAAVEPSAKKQKAASAESKTATAHRGKKRPSPEAETAPSAAEPKRKRAKAPPPEPKPRLLLKVKAPGGGL